MAMPDQPELQEHASILIPLDRLRERKPTARSVNSIRESASLSGTLQGWKD